ncbi:hypothetical protein ACFLXU_01415 [Chloroflexota bacterium]
MKKKQRQIQIVPAIMQTLKLTPQEVTTYFDEFSRLFRSKAAYLIPDKINDVMTLQWIIRLSQSMKILKQYEGFERHLNTYTKSQVKSSYFVTTIACYLVEKGVDDLILEPQIASTGKNPDILVNLKGEEVYLECKTIDSKQFDYLEEHNKMLEILHKYLNVPHQIDIRYKKSIPDTELHNLGKELHERLHHVKRDGKIINNDNFEVGVQVRDEYMPLTIKFSMFGIMEDLVDHCRYPSHSYGIDRHTISIGGPQVDFSKILRAKLSRSRKQYPDDKPYMLMIDGGIILGSQDANNRALASAFQPQVNTRFSAATLVDYHPTFESLGLVYDFKVVPNPFAKFPISKEFEKLFYKSH